MNNLRAMIWKIRRLFVLVAILVFIPALSARCAQPIADSHFHIANYAMQGVPLKTFIDKYMGNQITRSVVFALPLQQKWDYYEHYAGDRMAPNYYMGPKAGLYYYSAIDTMIALDFLKLTEADKARLDPMIVGFNPMDRYGVNHIKRMLLLFPGVFEGVGEFTIHKELVTDKIEDQPIGENMAPGERLPPDAGPSTVNSLYDPSLKAVLDFAGQAGLVVCLHNDLYPARVTTAGKVISLSPQAPYTAALAHLCLSSPKATVDWAHTGLGRFVKPTKNHLKMVSQTLDACANWYTDLSWDLVQAYIVHPEPGMPSLDEWARFVTKYQDRILWGSDSVIYTRNRIDDKGNPVRGGAMPVEDYLAVKDILKPLWDKVGPEVANKVMYANHVRLFDTARLKVRAWEAAHAKDNVWDLPVQK